MVPTLKGLRGITVAIPGTSSDDTIIWLLSPGTETAAGTALGLSGGSQAATLGQL